MGLGLQRKILVLSDLQFDILRLAVGEDPDGALGADVLRSLAHPSDLRAAILPLRRRGLLKHLEISDESLVPARIVVSAEGRRVHDSLARARHYGDADAL